MQELVITAFVNMGQNNGNTAYVGTLLSRASKEKGFRFEALKAYCAEFGKLSITEDKENPGTFKIKQESRFDAADLAKAKALTWFDWAPNEKPLVAPKIPESVAVTLGRGLATGELTIEDIKALPIV